MTDCLLPTAYYSLFLKQMAADPVPAAQIVQRRLLGPAALKRSSMRRAILLKEVLDTPVGLRDLQHFGGLATPGT